jgi:hypothetical protein
MKHSRHLIAAALLGIATAGQAPAADTAPDVSRLSPEARRLYTAVRSPRQGELKWQQIPWLVDLQEGIRQARAEDRPLLLFVSGDDPLEKC